MREFARRHASLLLVTMSLALVTPSFGQPAAAAGGGGATPPFDARETVGTILLGGLVGGVLGLSTLSFYKKPQDNIRNITIGAGSGMILSALYLTFNLASNPHGVSLVPVVDPVTEYAGLSGSLKF